MVRRIWILLLCLAIVAIVAALAASVHDVQFQPGKPFAANKENTSLPPPLSLNEVVSKPPLWKVLLLWLAFVANLILFFLLIPPKLRKRILRQVISMALGMLAILLALRYKVIQLPTIESEPVIGTGSGAATPVAGSPPPTFTPPQMQTGWVLLISFVVLAAMLLLLWAAYRWWLGPLGQRPSGMASIRDIARASLDDIASGRDWGDVIIQSYVRMNEAVSTRRGLLRAAAVTPREFAERLEQAGLPAQAVGRLTRLFEAVRYGSKASSQSDVNEAVACLNSILQACGQAQ